MADLAPEVWMASGSSGKRLLRWKTNFGDVLGVLGEIFFGFGCSGGDMVLREFEVTVMSTSSSQ